MKRKGFTLIEVLAVIVILAIIALIATPIMLGVIENARRKAFEDTGYGVIEGVKAYYVEKLSEEGVVGEKLFTFPNSELKLSGTEPAGGNAKLYADGSIEIAIHNNRWCATKAVNEDEVTTVDYVEGECKIPEPLPILSRSWWGGKNESAVYSIEIVNHKNVPSYAVYSWDASEKGDGSVVAWIINDLSSVSQSNSIMPNVNSNDFAFTESFVQPLADAVSPTIRIYIGGNGKVYAPEDSSHLFSKFYNAKEINVELLDTSKVKKMEYMFWGCESLTTLDVSNFDTSIVEDASSMFCGCDNLTDVDVSNFSSELQKYMFVCPN